MPQRPTLASNTTTAVAWLKHALPPAYSFTVGDWAPASLPAVARIADLGGGDEHLSQTALEPLVDVLARHTGTPGSCSFCIWNGYGWIWGGIGIVLLGRPPEAPPIEPSSGLDPEELARATFTMPIKGPDRDYVLWEGPVESMMELGWRADDVLPREYPDENLTGLDSFEPQIPDLMWPADGAWFFGTDTDFDWSYVSGTQALIDDLASSWPGVTAVSRAEQLD